ncbi:MAG: DUF4129 domain-containing protein [Pseudomonadota bacterium]
MAWRRHEAGVARALLIGLCLVLPLTADAQQRVEEGLEVTISGQAYVKALRLRGVDTDVAYYDPTRPPPSFETNATPDRERDPIDIGERQVSFTANVIAIAVLLAVIFAFMRYGGQFSVSFRGDEDATRGAGAPRSEGGDIATLPSDLDAIARISDRRLALVTLAQSALMRAVTQQGLFLQKSWTARDALRRLPREMAHRDTLSDLVAAGERVLFGGRDVPEDDFQAYLTRIRPLFSQAVP